MPIYKVQGPDGKVYRIEGPEGATADQLAAVITAQSAGKEQRAKQAEEAARKEFDPTIGMSGFDKFAAGAGKAITDIGRGVGQLVGAVSKEDVAESRKRDAALMNTGAGQAGNIVGNVAAFAPAAFIPGANTMTGGAAIGALSGLVQPATSAEERVKNTAVGGALGGAVPAAITALKTGRSLIEPLYQGGRDRIVGRAITDAAATDPTQLARALRGNQSAVPGVQRTVAEVADNPSLAALQRTASQANPAVMNEAAARAAANNEARSAFLSELAGKDGRREFMDAAREATARELYGKARAAGVDAGALTPEAQANIAAFQSRIPSEIMERAKELAKLQGVNMDNDSAVQGLHWIKMAVDSKIGTAKRAGDETLARAYMTLKNDLLDGMDQLSPAYGNARRTYAAMSKPIAEMDVVGAIADKAASPLTGNLQPAAFARALSDETAQRVTGMPTARLESVLGPQAMSGLGAVKDDLARVNFANTAGRGVGSDTVQKLAYSNILNEAGVPSFMRNLGPAGIVGNVAQRAGQIVYKDANEKLGEQLARALLNPNEAAGLVEAGMVTPQMQSLVNALRRGGTALGASAPALVQANQQ